MRARIGRRVDRRIASGAFGLALLVLGPAAAFSEGPSPSLARRDADTVVALFRLMRASEQRDYIVDFAFTRVRASDGQRLTSSITEARFGHAVLTRGGGSLTVDLPNAVYDCQQVDGAPSSCAKRAQTASIPSSEATAVLAAVGAYRAVRVGDAIIAGERARCFRLRARSARDEQPALGREATLCLASDGIPLRTRVTGVVSTDERVAVRVRRDIDEAALAPVLAGFDQAVPQVSR